VIAIVVILWRRQPLAEFRPRWLLFTSTTVCTIAALSALATRQWNSLAISGLGSVFMALLIYRNAPQRPDLTVSSRAPCDAVRTRWVLPVTRLRIVRRA
jgi:hypothetical protein